MRLLRSHALTRARSLNAKAAINGAGRPFWHRTFRGLVGTRVASLIFFSRLLCSRLPFVTLTTFKRYM